jgi:hypothetical protein
MSRAILAGGFVFLLRQIAVEASDLEHIPPFAGSIAAGAIGTQAVMLAQQT